MKNTYNERQIRRHTLDRSSSAGSLQDRCCQGRTHRPLHRHPHFRPYPLRPLGQFINFFCYDELKFGRYFLLHLHRRQLVYCRVHQPHSYQRCCSRVHYLRGFLGRFCFAITVARAVAHLCSLFCAATVAALISQLSVEALVKPC